VYIFFSEANVINEQTPNERNYFTVFEAIYDKAIDPSRSRAGGNMRQQHRSNVNTGSVKENVYL